MSSYSRSAGLFEGLFLLLITSACIPTGRAQTPEEVLLSYINLLSEGNVELAVHLRYTPLMEWSGVKEVVGVAFVLGIGLFVIRVTGMNPISTMLSCMLIEKYVSPENRKFVYLALLLLVVLSVVSVYLFLTSFLSRIVLKMDAVVLDRLDKVRVLETEFKGKEAYITYVLLYRGGERRERRAELVWRNGKWYVKKL